MTYRLIPLPVPVLTALLDRRLEDAVSLTGAPLTAFFLSQAWLWRIRLDQLLRNPADAEWIAKAALCEQGADAGLVVGHIGCHGAPDDRGMVEVAYSVAPELRRRGYATAMLAAALDWAAGTGEVRVNSRTPKTSLWSTCQSRGF